MRKILCMILAMAVCVCLLAAAGSPALAAPEGGAAEPGAGESGYTEAVMEIIGAALALLRLIVTAALTYIGVPFLRKTVVPWIKEHRDRSMIRILVEGAEQLANAGTIPKADKLAYVEDLLTDRGIEVTPEVRSMIESEVLNLGKASKRWFEELLDVIKEAFAAKKPESNEQAD